MYDAIAHAYDDTSMGLSFDANGNTLTSVATAGTTTYTWDFENRLSSVTLPGSGGSVNFKYDPFGRRIYKSSSAGMSVSPLPFPSGMIVLLPTETMPASKDCGCQ